MDYALLILGIAILVYSGDWLVKGGVRIAEYFSIPKIIVGVTIVSMGTSMPEFFVSLGAALNGNPDIATGNVVGSNIANLCLVLATSAIIISIPISRDIIKRDILILTIASIALLLICFDLKISRFDGAILLVIMAIYMIFSFKGLSKNKDNVGAPEEPVKKHNLAVSIIITLVSCGGLVLGSEMLVRSASSIASSLGVSERIISLTVVAVGTSLPELTTSIVAALRKQVDISVGNIIGSNIFNICTILGIVSCISPIDVNPSVLNFDMYFLIGSIVILGITIIPFKGKIQICRIEGVLLFAFYILYYALMFSGEQI